MADFDKLIEFVSSRGIRWVSSNKLLILIYHRVHDASPKVDLGDVSQHQFDWQMRLLAKYFNPLSLPDAIDCLAASNLPPRSVVVTFDDGYRDNHDVALPVLQKHQIPATFFIATGYLEGGIMWNDVIIELIANFPGHHLDLSTLGFGSFELNTIEARKQAIFALIPQIKYRPYQERVDLVMRMAEANDYTPPTNVMMDTAQVKALFDAGMTIGAHTVNHPILASESEEMVKQEIATGREYLEGLLGVPIEVFAYPNGPPETDYLSRDSGIVRVLGFKGAVSTTWGVNRYDTDPFQLNRFTPWDNTPGKFLLRLLRNYW